MGPNKKMGNVIIRAEGKTNSNQIVRMTFSGQNLAQTILCFQERPFFTISKQIAKISNSPKVNQQLPADGKYAQVADSPQDPGEWVVVYESEVKDGPNPSFCELVSSYGKLCSGNPDTPLLVVSLLTQFKLYVSVMCDNKKLKGEFVTSLNQLLQGEAKLDFKDTHTRQYSGGLQVRDVRQEAVYSMVDFIRGGTQLNLIVGIDFTASNGEPRNPSSLHYFNPANADTLNCYQQAILAVGEVLLNYDSDKLVAFS